MVNGRKPHFLEVFLPNLSSDRLEVPSKFVEHLEEKTSGSLSLIGPSGNIWHVNLIEINGNLYFSDGWPTFVKDHSIQCGDTLVFRYDGNLNFTVQIFDQSSCEKDEAFYANCSQGASDCDDNLTKKRERDVEVSMLNLVAEKKLKGSLHLTHLNFTAGKGNQKLKLSTKEVHNFKNKVTRGCDNSSSVVLALSASSGAERMASVVNFRVKNISLKKKKILKKDQKNGAQKMPSISKFIESRAAHYFTSSLPYFVRVMNYSNISGNGTMKIPTQFSKLHFPVNRIKVTLVNLNGDYWMVNSVPTAKRTTTMHTFCGGWLAFVRGNSIKIEDVCIFELVGDYEMRVRILRLGLEGLECQIGSSSVDVVGVGLGERHLETVETIAKDQGIDPPKDTDPTKKPCIPFNKKHNADILPYMSPEAGSSIGTVDSYTALQGPSCASTFSVDTSSYDFTPVLSDEHQVCSTRGTTLYQTSGNNQEDLQARCSMHLQPTAEEARDSLTFTSPFPNFIKVMTSSNVGGSFTLSVPSQFAAAHLPCHKAEIVLRNLRGESWNIISAHSGHQTKFCGGWMSFARRNDVKVGDICIFELLDESVFQVHVFEGSHKGSECVYDEAVADDLSTSVKSTDCGFLPD